MKSQDSGAFYGKRQSHFIWATLQAGLLGLWQPGWKPFLSLASPVERPWFPTSFGMLGLSGTTRLTAWARRATAEKPFSRTLLSGGSWSLPEQRRFSWNEREDAFACIETMGRAVVKPTNSGQSLGVTMGVVDQATYISALKALAREGFEGKDFLVEEEITGANYRLIASRRRALAIYERLPVQVIGNGHSSVGELVVERNAQLRQKWLDQPQIVLDRQSKNFLAAQGGLEFVPLKGEKVVVSPVCARSNGSEIREVTDATHPSILALGPEIVNRVPGADILGIDLILSGDHSVGVTQQSVVLLEANAPGELAAIMNPDSGTPRDIYRLILEDICLDAAISVREPVSHHKNALRLSHGSSRDEEVDKVIFESGCASSRVDGLLLGAILFVDGDSESLTGCLNRLGNNFGQIVAVSLTQNPHLTLTELDQLLSPPPLVPNDHSMALHKHSQEQRL